MIKAGDANRHAILVRGPTGVGKTKAIDAILSLKEGGSKSRVVLDGGWGVGERRYQGGSGRYADVVGRPEDILLLELGWGEPGDGVGAGATSKPNEWGEVLKGEGRQVHVVTLTAGLASVKTRYAKRMVEEGRPGSPEDAAAWWMTYQSNQNVRDLPSKLGVAETVIDTEGKRPDEVARLILERTGVI